jgi:beta-galactosidase
MKSKTYRLVLIGLATILTGLSLGAFAASTVASRDRSFDSGWRFLRADAPGAETSAFDDSTWLKPATVVVQAR